MKVKYQAPKGHRMNYLFMGATTYEDLWFDHTNNKWSSYKMEPELSDRGNYSSHSRCLTVKAFKRQMAKAQKYLPAGIEFILVSRYTGCDVTYVTR